MKRSKFTETQITNAINANEAGKELWQICREPKIKRATFYNLTKWYSGMDAELLLQFKEIQLESMELKRMCVDMNFGKSETLQRILVVEEDISVVSACRVINLDRSMLYFASFKDDIEIESKLNSYLEIKVICDRGCT